MGNTLRDWYKPEKEQIHKFPLVTVICTCYNHAKYVKSALDSVLDQQHEHIEIIIIDNGSRDSSPSIIRDWVASNSSSRHCITFFHPVPINYCQSFNQGLKLAKGKYIIDLSGDDVLLSNHIGTAVETLEAGNAGVYFCNAYLEGRKLPDGTTFHPGDSLGNKIREYTAEGMYLQVVQKNFLCAATLVFRTDLLKKEGGYDEGLAYEDFDIIVRMARKYPFVFHKNIGVRKRILKSSFSAKQYRVKNSIMLPSTLKVCRKIYGMNKTPEENQALQKRVMYETKHALASANFETAAQFLALARETGISNFRYLLFRFWAWGRFDLSLLYRMFYS